MFIKEKTHLTIQNNVKVGIRIQLDGEWWQYRYADKTYMRVQKATKYCSTPKVSHFASMKEIEQKILPSIVEDLKAGITYAIMIPKKK